MACCYSAEGLFEGISLPQRVRYCSLEYRIHDSTEKCPEEKSTSRCPQQDDAPEVSG